MYLLLNLYFLATHGEPNGFCLFIRLVDLIFCIRSWNLYWYPYCFEYFLFCSWDLKTYVILRSTFNILAVEIEVLIFVSVFSVFLCYHMIHMVKPIIFCFWLSSCQSKCIQGPKTPSEKSYPVNSLFLYKWRKDETNFSKALLWEVDLLIYCFRKSTSIIFLNSNGMHLCGTFLSIAWTCLDFSYLSGNSNYFWSMSS